MQVASVGARAMTMKGLYASQVFRKLLAQSQDRFGRGV